MISHTIQLANSRVTIVILRASGEGAHLNEICEDSEVSDCVNRPETPLNNWKVASNELKTAKK